MTKRVNKTSQRQVARIIGFTLLLMAVVSGAAFGGIHPILFHVPTENLIQELSHSINLLYVEIALWTVVVITDLVVSWALHLYLRPDQPRLSLWTASLRLVYTAILAFSITYLVNIAGLVRSHSDIDALQIANLEADFMTVWAFGLIIFGLHLVSLGWLVWKSQNLPKWIALLLWFGGISYSVVHALMVMGPTYSDLTATLESTLMLPMALAELSLALWMIFRGGKKEVRNDSDASSPSQTVPSAS